jgi:ferritin-like metal-binding protein YciE
MTQFLSPEVSSVEFARDGGRAAALVRFRRMELESLRDLYIHELKDLYSAEKQMISNMPKMVKAATNKQLASAFKQHLEQTKRQAKRIEDVLKSHDESTRGPKCQGMEGVLREGDEMVQEDAEDEVRDAGLIAAAQRAEHYEIAGYGCARTYAELLGDKKGARILDMNLREEAATDQKLTKLAKSVINLQAKKAPSKAARKEKQQEKSSGVTGAIKQMVEKVTG